MSFPSTQLDHIIILVPYTFLTSPPTWLTDHFTLIPGGRHADNVTANALVILADGSYLEFVAFVDDNDIGEEKRAAHFFGGQGENCVVAWCLTGQIGGGDGGSNHNGFKYKDLVQRVENAQTHRKSSGQDVIIYHEPVKGGRHRPDGKYVGWTVTFPAALPHLSSDSTSSSPNDDVRIRKAAKKVYGMPFFCHDETPRIVRTFTDEEDSKEKVTAHPSGATGIKHLKIEVDEEIGAWYKFVLMAATDNVGCEKLTMGTVHGDGVVDVSISSKEKQANEGQTLGARITEIHFAVDRDSPVVGKSVGEGEIKVVFVER